MPCRDFFHKHSSKHGLCLVSCRHVHKLDRADTLQELRATLHFGRNVPAGSVHRRNGQVVHGLPAAIVRHGADSQRHLVPALGIL